jgi:3-dehydroquinate dehydratase-2
MTSIFVLHGPNLNLLGKREPDWYGNKTLAEIDQMLIEEGKKLELEVRTSQSNSEGVLIDLLQESAQWAQGVIFNPGGYTHTSIALRDTITAIQIPVIEVHLSNVYAREDFRHRSTISAVCRGKIVGFGWRSYWLAIHALAGIIQENNKTR